MYLRGSKWNMNRRTRRYWNPWRFIFFIFFVGAALYINQFVVTSSPAFNPPTATPTRSAESHVHDGAELFAQGKFQQSISAYQQAIQAEPLNKANYVALAQAQIWASQYEEALETAEMALIGNENYSMAHAVRGWALGYLDQFMEAEDAIRRALELDVNNALAYAYQAEIYVRQADYGAYQRAIESSRKAMELAPTSFESLRARGMVLFVTDNRAESIQMFTRAAEINKNIPDVFMYLGYNYKAEGQLDSSYYDRAVEMFMKANMLNPSDSIPDLEISRVYLITGELGKAVQYAENAVNDEPDNPLRYGNLGIMLYRSGDYNGAVEAFNMAVKGGTTENGIVVKGLTLEARVANYFAIYGLSLARATPNRCLEAVPVFQALLNAMPNDQITVDNANAGLELCAQAVGASSPTP
jgi:tetratricopeptide (TPR) repeat protein